MIAPMGGDLGVGVERKALHAGTAGTGKRGRLALGAKARANAPDLLASSLAKGDALLHRGRHGAGQLGGGIDQRIIAGRHRGIAARFQVSQVAQCTDDAPTDVLDHGHNIDISGRLDLDEARFEAGLGAIQIDSLKEDEVEMEIEIDGAAKALDKGHRSRLDFGPLDTSCDRLVHVILTDRGANNRMDRGGEVSSLDEDLRFPPRL
jgi:hypothetical protein